MKLLLTLIFISLGFYLFLEGYSVLKYQMQKNITKTSNNINASINDSINLPKEKPNDDKKQTNLIVDTNSLQNNKITIRVKKNDTFSRIISPFFQKNKIKNEIIKKLSEVYNLKNIKIGQEIYFYENNNNIIEKIIIPVDFATNILIKIIDNNIFLSKQKIEYISEIEAKKVIIKSSLYEDGRNSGIPLSVLSESIKLFSFDVDFQRDIQKDDELEISYETFFSDKRKNTSYGNIKYINLRLQNNNLEYFLFETEDNFVDYFDKEGKNIKKALMKTPIDGARLSSTYGVRKHPILGYNKLHKGVDFAAPKGTPVFAAGNGVVEYVGNNGGYGKYIRIRHNSSYKTAYAHLNSFKKNISAGIRVKQGNIIGYVGSTGNSTGPHLHYEILYQGKQINPMKLKLPPRKKLKGVELEKFKVVAKNIYLEFLYSLYE